MTMKERGILALDNMDPDAAWKLTQLCRDHVWGVKGNSLLFMQKAGGISPTSWYRHHKVPFFADAKLHDIPQTVANSAKELAEQGAALITVHASGGEAMMHAAVESYGHHRPQGGLGILAVTVLTSLTHKECVRTYGRTPRNMVLTFARWAVAAGCYGIVCSAEELPLLNTSEFRLLKKVVPGIRLPGGATHDQARLGTPKTVLENGADFLVVGRPIAQAGDPLAAIAEFNRALSN